MKKRNNLLSMAFLLLLVPSYLFGQTITVTSPNGGEIWNAGTDHNITWNIAGGTVANVRIQYSTNGGSTWVTISSSYAAGGAGSYSYNWTVPNVQYTICKVRVQNAVSPFTPSDASNNNFTIKGIAVIAPNGGEIMDRGSVYTISWISSGIANVKLEYSTDGGTSYSTVSGGASVASGGIATNDFVTFDWTVPSVLTENLLMRISDVTDATVVDVSDDVNTIMGLDVTAPNGGEIYTAGTVQNISWNSTGIANVNLEYSTDGGTSYNPVAGGTSLPSGIGSTFLWTVPNVPSANCLVRISNDLDAGYNDISNAVFTIKGVVTIQPNGGESLSTGSVYTISWNSVSIANVKLEYSTDGGGSYNTITGGASLPAGGIVTFDWTVPNTPSTNCLIKISDVTNALLFDESDAVFSIAVASPPDLISPVDKITGIPLRPRLNWSAVAGASSYTVTISTSNTFPVGPNTFTITTANTYAIVPELNILTANTEYFWKVETSGSPSLPWSFYTTPLLTVTLNNPVSPELSLAPILTWRSNAVGIGMRYKLQLVQQTAMPDTNQWNSGATVLIDHPLVSYRTNTLIGGRTYWWRIIAVRTYDSGNIRVYGYSAPASFTTAGGTTVLCTPTFPTGGITLKHSPITASWYGSIYQNGLKYQIKYNIGSGSTTDGELNSGTKYPLDGDMPLADATNLFITFPSVSNNSHVYWQVRVYDPSISSFGAWSAVEDFIFKGSGTLYKPTLTYPIDNVTIYTTSPLLSWYIGEAFSGLTFRVYYRVAGAGSWTGPIASTNTFYSLSGLTPGTNYEWYVASYNGVTESTPSTTGTFSVAGGASSYAVATNPLNDLMVYTNKPIVSWYVEGANLGITGFDIEYRLQGSGVWIHSGGIPTVSGSYTNFYELPVLEWGGAYEWRVGKYDGVTTSFNALGEGSFTVTGGSTNAPILMNPPDASIVYTSTVYLSWYINGSTAGIQNFILEYTPSMNFTNPELTTTEILSPTTLAKNVTGLISGATYWWRVRAWYGGSVYANSPTYSFTIDLGSFSVVQPLIGGPNNITVDTKNPILSWYTPIQAANRQKYELEVSRDRSFSGSTKYTDLTINRQTVSGLEDGEYFWRVRGKSNTGDYSYYSSVGKFSINGCVVSIDKGNEVPTTYTLLQNYPNPFNPTTKIKFSIPEAAFVSLKIYDILGREVKTLISQEMTAGLHIVNWNGDTDSGGKLSSGTYIYSISAGKFNQARKMTLLK